jgi:protein-S-isoprenylcysteine O-methyltransferase Ste14
MTLVQRSRVPAGFFFACFYLYFSQPRQGFFAAGLAVAASGLALRIWASGHLEKGIRLAVQGPYQRTRNPLYLGSFLMGLGFTLAAATPWLLALFLVLFLTIYIPVMRREEQELEQAFGHDYEVYRLRVPLFVPSLKSRGPAQKFLEAGAERNFQWHRVILNREYKAVIGFLIVSIWVGVKMLWT